MATITKDNNLEQKRIVTAISKLRVVKPKDYDWKQDYAEALEKKYENIYRH